MRLSDFDYPIQQQAIAQFPSPLRDRSRLLVLHRESGRMEHRTFFDLPELMEKGEVLVLNDSRVFPARLTGTRESGGKTEILLLHPRTPFQWEALFKGKFRKFQILYLKGGLEGKLVESLGEGRVLIEFGKDEPAVKNHFLAHGEVPLPPYIKREKNLFEEEDRKNYQTVYARTDGSVAAPTAGLHFTETLLNRIREKGIEVVALTLHVGPGTFKPVQSEEIENHLMDQERFALPEVTAKTVRLAKAAKRKIVAVGTTTTRVLEGVANRNGELRCEEGWTSFFIKPGYSFKVVDGLVTNFHLPRTTLLMLVSAFAGRELVLKAYGTALKENYRFYSYGDAMLIR